jgi:hypothetical protein
MRTLLLLISVVFVPMAVRGELDDLERPASAIENQTSDINNGLTIPKHLDLQWNDKSKLPTSVRIKNPFQEDIQILTSSIGGYIGYPGLEIECYDPDSKSWRLPLQIPGSFTGQRVIIRHGQHKDFLLSDDFWWFVTVRLPSITSAKSLRFRLVYSFGEVSLRSEEFEWTIKAKP